MVAEANHGLPPNHHEFLTQGGSQLTAPFFCCCFRAAHFVQSPLPQRGLRAARETHRETLSTASDERIVWLQPRQ
jgi:hypothetical protein